MSAILLFCSFLVGWVEKSLRNSLLLIVPLAIAVSFQLIADIDTPQGGLIRVLLQNPSEESRQQTAYIRRL